MARSKPPARRPDGTLLPGATLRTSTKRASALGLSRRLRREAARRFKGDPEGLYFLLLDIAENTANEPKDRIKAIEVYATRMDGKPTQAVELTLGGKEGQPLEVASTVTHDDPNARPRAVADGLRALAALAQSGFLDSLRNAGGGAGVVASGGVGAAGLPAGGDPVQK